MARAAPPPGDSDDEDMPDYRVLAAISQRHAVGSDAPAPAIPKRGEKDFEPTGFGGQTQALEQSRAALFSTIALPRAHSRCVPSVRALTISKSLSTATWDPVFQRAFVHVLRGQSCSNVGVSERRCIGDAHVTCLELLPEEAVYLIERGALDCRWTRTPGNVPRAEQHAMLIPISVAQAYAQLLGCDESTLARYQIYAYLKRLGYIVQRAALVDRLRPPATPVASKRGCDLRMWLIALLRLFFAPVRLILRCISWLVRVVTRRWREHAGRRSLLGISASDSYGTSCW